MHNCCVLWKDAWRLCFLTNSLTSYAVLCTHTEQARRGLEASDASQELLMLWKLASISLICSKCTSSQIRGFLESPISGMHASLFWVCGSYLPTRKIVQTAGRPLISHDWNRGHLSHSRVTCRMCSRRQGLSLLMTQIMGYPPTAVSTKWYPISRLQVRVLL